MPEMFVTSYSVTYCIYIPGIPGFVFISIVQFMMSANSRIRFGLQIVFVCLYITPSHYHHCANFIWRHWTYKMPVRYNLSSVWIRLNIFSQLSIIQYMGLCVFRLPISFVMIERIDIMCVIIIIKSEVWTITHCFGLGHETMVCAVCLSIFLCCGYMEACEKCCHPVLSIIQIQHCKFYNIPSFITNNMIIILRHKIDDDLEDSVVRVGIESITLIR